MSKRIHIVIAESSAIIRCGVVTILQRAENLNADIAELSDVSVFTSGSYRQTPDILVVNPAQLGIFSAAQLRGDLGNDNLKIVALQSAFTEQGMLQNYDEVLSIYDSADTVVEKISAVTRRDDADQTKKDLSQREKEIIVSVVKGMTNKQIADALCLSTHTVIAHRRNIASKLQIHSPAGLTIYAIVNKLVDLADIKNSISQGRDDMNGQ
ncbi:MAG: LuxR C-terminal-related transcriptional regulator [Rikenellaceae bacterium]